MTPFNAACCWPSSPWARTRASGLATGEHGEREAALRHVRRDFITIDNLRTAVTKLVNATFAARDTAWWGRGTACASDYVDTHCASIVGFA
ncbi:Tn3 family transposase [Streptomyces lunalinharesii]|uniref:Tn3 transposase DDE domain-containing protein n=1 Tax=Streptomyces lunalinharesii TaxID=333384 RepID=A0ABP6E2Z1_9ACTN